MPSKITRKVIKKDRWWKHIKFHLPIRVFGGDLREIRGYDPEKWREAFERFQSHGESNLSREELDGIHPLIAAQKGKEIMLTSLAEECMEFWAKGWGWAIPVLSVLQKPAQSEELPLDRLTKVAVLRMAKTIFKDPLGFFMRHPGIKELQKQRHLAVFLSETA